MGTEIEPRKPKMTPRMKLFADEWMTGEATGKRFNGRAAAEHAGYSVDNQNPSTYASRLLKHPAIQEYIKENFEAEAMGVGEALQRFTEIARAEVGDVIRLDPSGQRLEIDPNKVIQNKRFIKQFGFDSNGNPKIEFHDSHAALRDIARVLGMLKDGLELTGPGGGGVPVTMTVQFVNPDGSLHSPVPEGQQALPAAEDDYSDLEALG